MKVLLAVIGLVLIATQAINGDQELADKLKPYEAFSPYKWTQWIAMRPPKRPIAAAAVAYAPQPNYPEPEDDSAPTSSEEDEEDEDEYDGLDGNNAFENWFKRSILPQPPPTPEKKSKSKPKKPSIVDVPADFWAPPPSIAPNLTLPPPPGYWAAKKSMFVSKLFAALAKSVFNTTGPPEEITTTTASPREAIMDELSHVLLSDITRSTHEDPMNEAEESDEDSEEETPKVNPFLLSQVEFLAKLTEAIAAQSKPAPATTTTTTTPKPKWHKPTSKPKKGSKKGSKKSKKKGKTPKYLKYIPTTTTPAPTEAVPEAPAIDYNALAKALLGN